MGTLIGFALAAFISAAQAPPCTTDQVLSVEHGRDYVLNVCQVGRVALRGVEPPLRTPNVVRLREGVSIGGELLGGRNIGADAVAYLSGIIGQRVTLVYDGWRIGDLEGRRYAYVFVADKTFVNAEMIQRGYGYADRQGSHPRRDEFIALEATARRLKRGVWQS